MTVFRIINRYGESPKKIFKHHETACKELDYMATCFSALKLSEEGVELVDKNGESYFWIEELLFIE